MSIQIVKAIQRIFITNVNRFEISVKRLVPDPVGTEPDQRFQRQ